MQQTVADIYCIIINIRMSILHCGYFLEYDN